VNAPVSAEALQHFLSGFAPGMMDFYVPEGKFDPAGSWKQVYRMWSIQPRISPKTIDGYLTLRRESRDGGIALDVEQQTLMKGTGAGPIHSRPFAYWHKASIQCQANRWCTPQRWTAETWGTDQEKNVEPLTHVKFAAEVLGQEIRFSGIQNPAVHVAADWTMDWTLLEALQRLPAEENGNLAFDMIEDLDLLRPGQQLTFIRPFEANLAGKATQVYGFCQIGTGTLPITYLLDQNHRLLLAMHNIRAFILQPKMSS
jgi:hypothetical protein